MIAIKMFCFHQYQYIKCIDPQTTKRLINYHFGFTFYRISHSLAYSYFLISKLHHKMKRNSCLLEPFSIIFIRYKLVKRLSIWHSHIVRTRKKYISLVKCRDMA